MTVQAPHSYLSTSSDSYFNLGTYTRPITTRHPDAQLWFDRGLLWSYAFNHEEAVSCFDRAIAADADCAMAYWGLAYALGPNYNKPWDYFEENELRSGVERTHAAAQTALEKSSAASPVEQALIRALQHRYPSTPASPDASDWKIWNESYAKAMSEVHTSFRFDLDVAALYADALMNIHPWKLWDIRTGQSTTPQTLEIKSVLETALALPNGNKHPALLHLHIHLMEMSPTPEAALPSADALMDLVPDAGHLQHMPSHIYILLGLYALAVASNTSAIAADERYFALHPEPTFYSVYRAHDLHFRIYAAMFAGMSKVALETVSMMEQAMGEAQLRVTSPPMADWLEGSLAVRVHVLVRFGMWDELLALREPVDKQLYCSVIAFQHYGKGVAFAATGRAAEAEKQRRLLEEAVKRVPNSRTIFNNTVADILAVAGAMLDGELEYRRGNIEPAFKHLRKAIELDDTLPYDEPWGWMQPTRHAYGALLLEQGRVEDAEAVYRADLGLDGTLPRAQQHPKNLWSLHGYHECLMKLGKEKEAAEIKPKLDEAMGDADVPIAASCACRLTTAQNR
jgi:tetratricopeptide (TPR) repeat protein